MEPSLELNAGVSRSVGRFLKKKDQRVSHINGFNWADFLRTYWNKMPLHVRQGTDFVLDAQEILSQINEFSIKNLKLMRDQKRVNTEILQLARDKNIASIRKLKKFVWAENGTLVVEFLENYSREIAVMCKQLEKLFGCWVHCNLYLTPPHSQGLKKHWDDHDVIVLQVEGEKEWLIEDRVTPREISQKWLHPDRKFRKTKTLLRPIVKAQDILYVPMGFPHMAKTGASHSVHLTFGINTYTEYFKESHLWKPVVRWIQRNR